MVSAFSIGTAKRQDPGGKKEGPPPNAYQPIIMPKQYAPKWTIGGQDKRHFRSTSIAPGPGAYNQSSKFVEGPKYSIKGRQHEQKTVSQSPGPGNYNDESFSSIYQKMPSYSIGVKHHTTIPVGEQKPGPGQYDLNQSWLSNGSMKFPTQPRLASNSSNYGPGPGQYDINQGAKITLEKTQPSWLIGTGKRDQDKHNQNIPGPGTYNIKSLLNISKNFTFKVKTTKKDLNISQPGPGTYNQDISFLKQHMPAYKIGTQPKSTKASNGIYVPGPGKYYNDQMDILSSLQKSAPSFKMPKAQRKDLNDSSIGPGPGAYSIPKIVDHQPVSFKGSTIKSHYFLGPGPGTYNVDDSFIKQRDGSVKIVPEHQRQKVNGKTPGPGQYSMKSTLEGPRWGFGKEDRSRVSSIYENKPGPGAYNVPPKFNEVPKYLNCKPKMEF